MASSPGDGGGSGKEDSNAAVRRLAGQLVELEVALAETRAEQQANRAFLADAAHQLRTPFAGIQACAEALLRGAPPEDRDTLFANVVRETSRAVRLVADLDTLGRLHGGEAVDRRDTDLVELCREEISRVWSLAPQLDVVLRAPRLVWSAPIDPAAVREILANLLDNARRHARNRIDVGVQAHDDHVGVRVADDGPGVAPDKTEAIFQRFVTLDGMGGSGLGLTIARDLARAHGGDLTHEDGAFVLRLPLSAKDI